MRPYCLVLAGAALLLAFALPAPAKRKNRFVSIFDGKTLNGWHVSAQTGHSGASGHKSGGRWVVENGAILGSQDIPGNGGIIITDRPYGDFEVALEMNNDYGPDSGLFLRGNDRGQAYQAMIDYHDNGNLMGVYGEGIGGFVARNFVLLETPDRIRLSSESSFPLPFAPDAWPRIWKHGKWNELRARIAGNPPTIHTWINGKKIIEWADSEKRHPDQGGIALQVHGGGDLTKQFVRYRKVRVRLLDK
jgi:hypothetical protein